MTGSPSKSPHSLDHPSFSSTPLTRVINPLSPTSLPITDAQPCKYKSPNEKDHPSAKTCIKKTFTFNANSNKWSVNPYPLCEVKPGKNPKDVSMNMKSAASTPPTGTVKTERKGVGKGKGKINMEKPPSTSMIVSDEKKKGKGKGKGKSNMVNVPSTSMIVLEDKSKQSEIAKPKRQKQPRVRQTKLKLVKSKKNVVSVNDENIPLFHDDNQSAEFQDGQIFM